MDDGLFPAPQPAHPDEQVAHEEIDRYYADQVDEARVALAKAQAELDQRLAAQAAWLDRCEITPDVIGSTDMAPLAIAASSSSRYQRAMRPLLAQMDVVAGRVINRDPAGAAQMRAEVERWGERERALRRWLTAQGHRMGALAEPPPVQPRRARRRDA